MRLPHPIPYQGSKRNLAPLIGRHIPKPTCVMFEPFAGSAAMTIYAAQHGLAKRFVLGDALEPLVSLWKLIVDSPRKASGRYREVWLGQEEADEKYFNFVRTRYNEQKDPVDLLYLICRCVKNAVRFNSAGMFTQSVDKRRLGMSPDKMDESINRVSALLRGKVEFRSGDWRNTTSDATTSDFVYMDPPYLGTTIGRDKRYAEQLASETLIEGLLSLRNREIPFALSYDGMTGEKEYGPPLPAHLGMTRLLLNAGRSSQATLVGRSEVTFESLYLSPCIAEAASKLGVVKQEIAQDCLAF